MFNFIPVSNLYTSCSPYTGKSQNTAITWLFTYTGELKCLQMLVPGPLPYKLTIKESLDAHERCGVVCRVQLLTPSWSHCCVLQESLAILSTVWSLNSFGKCSHGPIIRGLQLFMRCLEGKVTASSVLFPSLSFLSSKGNSSIIW